MSTWGSAVWLDRGVIGWDVGGAHLKVAAIGSDDSLLWVRQLPLPLWRGLSHLDETVSQIAKVDDLSRYEHVVTMTGELVDLFDDRKDGVVTLATRLQGLLPTPEFRLYAGGRGWVVPSQAASAALDIASANWHATAAWLARCHPRGVLVDIGSTTTDILAFHDGEVAHRGFSDRERLASEELVYTGIVRTPVMAVAQRVPLQGEWLSLANEHFATMADVYRVLELLPANADQHDTADGRDKSLQSSMRRLARMVGADVQDANPSEWHCLAAYIAERQMDSIANACWRQLSRPGVGRATLFGAGIGKFLVHPLAQRLGCDTADLDALLGRPQFGDLPAASCAPAVAVARLARLQVLSCAC
ncbi:MAG: hypothetical protein KDI82_01885 [Gammaproteobacteria bacterium]|nr:hypothetical protein [Gammaproteobacteria bacterium]